MDPSIYIIVGAVFGVISAVVASSKGRSAVIWFIMGLLFGWIALLIVACLSNVKEEKGYRDRQSRENRRLREQLRQEQMKAEAFRAHTQGRLDSHDHQLGVDTRQPQQALPGQSYSQPSMLEAPQDHDPFATQTQAPRQNPATPPQSMGASRQWYYEMHGEVQGPVEEPQLLGMFQSRRLDGTTLVWSEELGDWKLANQIRALREYVS